MNHLTDDSGENDEPGETDVAAELGDAASADSIAGAPSNQGHRADSAPGGAASANSTADSTAGAADTLHAALARHGFVLPDEQVAQLDRYCRLLWQWNERLNLTRHTTYEKFVSRDLSDTLALAAQLEPHQRVLDVGSGSGVPGIPLAIVRPDLKVSLVDSVAKKCRALADIVAELGLDVPVHNSRVQDLLAGMPPSAAPLDVLVARAVGQLERLLSWLQPHIGRAFDTLLLVKGPQWVEERHLARQKRLLEGLELRKVAAYHVPGMDAESVILRIRPLTSQLAATPTRPTKVPRAANSPPKTKRPGGKNPLRQKRRPPRGQ